MSTRANPSTTSVNMIKFILFSPTFFVFYPSVMSQTRPSSDGSHGKWHLLHANVGISAMHMQLMHDNKVVIFDRTDFGPSNISLPGGRCRIDPNDAALKIDCTAHSILYDIITDTYRPLMVQTDTWCSSGAVLPNGTLVQTGGFHDGDNVTRMYTSCSNDVCDWVEFPNYLSRRRWYATNQILPDGRIIIIGGRREFSYEFFPRLSPRRRTFHLRFLTQTREGSVENNLYPYVHLLPDGNLFIFANTRSILFDYNQNRVVREFPRIPGGDPRNYPSTGSSVLLPLDENEHRIAPEVMVCGGAPRGAYQQALRRTYARAISTCGRLRITDDQNAIWVMETMPIPRVMGDMLLLPTGDVIIINGGQSGTAGWELGRQAATRPVIYRPANPSDQRFSVMTPSRRPRMYHSAAILLTDGRVLVGGGNPHIYYNFSNVFYPTDLSLETFSPPYLSTQYASIRPVILSVDDTVSPGQSFLLSFSVGEFSAESVLSVRIVAPSFTTHSYSMNQRMVVLRTDEIIDNDKSSYTLSVVGPSSAEIAPPGYYLLFVVHSGIPSSGVWVRIQ